MSQCLLEEVININKFKNIDDMNLRTRKILFYSSSFSSLVVSLLINGRSIALNFDFKVISWVIIILSLVSTFSFWIMSFNKRLFSNISLIGIIISTNRFAKQDIVFSLIFGMAIIVITKLLDGQTQNLPTDYYDEIFHTILALIFCIIAITFHIHSLAKYIFVECKKQMQPLKKSGSIR